MNVLGRDPGAACDAARRTYPWLNTVTPPGWAEMLDAARLGEPGLYPVFTMTPKLLQIHLQSTPALVIHPPNVTPPKILMQTLSCTLGPGCRTEFVMMWRGIYFGRFGLPLSFIQKAFRPERVKKGPAWQRPDAYPGGISVFRFARQREPLG